MKTPQWLTNFYRKWWAPVTPPDMVIPIYQGDRVTAQQDEKLHELEFRRGIGADISLQRDGPYQDAALQAMQSKAGKHRLSEDRPMGEASAKVMAQFSEADLEADMPLSKAKVDKRPRRVSMKARKALKKVKARKAKKAKRRK